MARDIIENQSDPHGRCQLARQLSAPAAVLRQPIPFTAPGNLQCPLEFWIHSQSNSEKTEKTPLLNKGSKSKYFFLIDYFIYKLILDFVEFRIYILTPLEHCAQIFGRSNK